MWLMSGGAKNEGAPLEVDLHGHVPFANASPRPTPAAVSAAAQ